mmetsp:Transcript_10254/g.22364  ORF Transcript_10254/g.22364 Transcript_10254/m.22364 type:complete len:229 (-) Transcript_10254:3-689(-)
MSACRHEANHQCSEPIVEGQLWQLSRIWVCPQEEGPKNTYSQLQRSNSHGITGSPTCGLQSKLVGDVVIIVPKVPEEEICQEGKVKTAALLGLCLACSSSLTSDTRCWLELPQSLGSTGCQQDWLGLCCPGTDAAAAAHAQRSRPGGGGERERGGALLGAGWANEERGGEAYECPCSDTQEQQRHHDCPSFSCHGSLLLARLLQAGLNSKLRLAGSKPRFPSPTSQKA